MKLVSVMCLCLFATACSAAPKTAPGISGLWVDSNGNYICLSEDKKTTVLQEDALLDSPTCPSPDSQWLAVSIISNGVAKTTPNKKFLGAECASKNCGPVYAPVRISMRSHRLFIEKDGSSEFYSRAE